MADTVLDLGGDLREPARARAFLGEHLAGCSGDVRADALLMVSELVSNVVQHGQLPARMTVDLSDVRLRVVVEDSGASFPQGPSLPAEDATSGRGLIIIASIATAWGVSTAADRVGKGVWFELLVSA